jgi:hypothetical protein
MLVQRDPWGRERILRFREITSAAVRKEISVEEALNQIARIDPSGAVVEYIKRHHLSLTALLFAFFAMVQAQLNSANSDSAATAAVNRIQAQMQGGQITQSQLLEKIDQSVRDLPNALAAPLQSPAPSQDKIRIETQPSETKPPPKNKASTAHGQRNALNGGPNRKERRKAEALERKSPHRWGKIQ